MNDERSLAVLRKAQKGIMAGFRWMPYSDELGENITQERYQEWVRDRDVIDAALTTIRLELMKAGEAILDAAEQRGSKP